jgi:hypothetical protein
VFDFIEKNQTKLNIENYGISLTTLEEVFLKVAGMREEMIKEKDNEKDKEKVEAKSGSILLGDINEKDLSVLRESKE